jgi:molybdopterin converting factor small subunit
MVTVAVELVGVLSSNSGKKNLTLSLSDKADVQSLLMELEGTRVQKGSLLAWSGRVPRAKILVLVNRAEVSVLEGLKTGLNDGDSVTLVPVSHGG